MDTLDRFETAIVDHLTTAGRSVAEGAFDKARAAIDEARALDGHNFYLLALEKQVSKVMTLDPSDAGRNDALRAIPVMIDRAIGEIRRKADLPQPPVAGPDKKEAALEKLRSQYFRRAEAYVERKDYARAVSEIRRVAILDPQNKAAEEYEAKIRQLESMQQKTGGQAASASERTVPPPKLQPSSTAGPSHQATARSTARTRSRVPLIAAAVVPVVSAGLWFFASTDSQNGTPPAVQREVVTRTGASAQPNVVQASISQPVTPTPSASDPQPVRIVSQPPVEEPVMANEGTKTQVSEDEVALKPEKEDEPAYKPAPHKPTPPKSVRKISTPEEVKQKSPEPAKADPVRSTKSASPSFATTAPALETKSTEPSAPMNVPVSASVEQPRNESEAAIPRPFVAIEAPPEVLKRELPKYPEIAFRLKTEGRVVVEVTVDKTGNPVHTKILKSDNVLLNGAAVDAALKSTYKPAVVSTGPVPGKVALPFDFRIKK